MNYKLLLLSLCCIYAITIIAINNWIGLAAPMLLKGTFPLIVFFENEFIQDFREVILFVEYLGHNPPHWSFAGWEFYEELSLFGYAGFLTTFTSNLNCIWIDKIKWGRPMPGIELWVPASKSSKSKSTF